MMFLKGVIETNSLLKYKETLKIWLLLCSPVQPFSGSKQLLCSSSAQLPGLQTKLLIS